MRPVLQLHEFFVEGNDPFASHVLLNITEPSTPEEMDKGYFFAVCEISGGDNKYISRAQEMVDEIENSYYETGDEADRNSLEIILDKINQQFMAIAKKDSPLNCALGAIRQGDVIFSFCGQPQMLLFYKHRDQYDKMDLIAENTGDENPEDRQLFSQIVQGKISANDFFYVSTSRVADYFSHDRLQKIISSRPPRQSAEHLQKVLSELKNNLSFGGIIIHRESEGDEGVMPKISLPKKGSVKSLANLFHTEQNTARILSPSIFPRLPDKAPPGEERALPARPAPARLAHLRQHASRTAPAKRIDYSAALRALARGAAAFLRFLTNALIWLAKFFIAVFAGIGKGLGLIFIVAINYQNRRGLVLGHYGRQWRAYKDFIKRMPLLTKILIATGFLAAIGLVAGVSYLKMKQKQDNEERAAKSAIETIRGQLTSAESALIYNNSAAALGQLTEAEALLQKLNCEKKPGECGELKSQLDALFAKTRKETRARAEMLADWSALSPGLALKLVAMNKEIFGYGPTTSLLYYNFVSKESALVPGSLAVNGFARAAAPKENDFIALLNDDLKNLSVFKPKDRAWQSIDIEHPSAGAATLAISVYNRRMYTVSDKQIYRHDGIRAGYGRGKEWLSEPAELSDTIDLVIDGDLWTLSKTGRLQKFTGGKKQAFEITGLNPALDSADDIWTYTDLNYLYILDGARERIVLLGKDGQLQRQITALELKGATGMAVDETNMSAIFVSQGKLYQISLK
ncbi:hypothetical protein EPN28_03665 [Patescibacteria group bacterium]|nr:MAG: hypothetical protein EPN28_03665 [Patescibacteria group bacterium]